MQVIKRIYTYNNAGYIINYWVDTSLNFSQLFLSSNKRLSAEINI